MAVPEKLLLKISCDNWLVVFGILVAILLRNITTLHPYSGQGDPPMYGDYEAQRHWMEVTTNLPVIEWYQNTSDNNLQYWGLDYPPLTAYHMYLCGVVASYVNENYTSLHLSRGFEREDHKVFMRLIVMICDILVYIPSLVLFYHICAKMIHQDVTTKKCQLLLPFSLCTILALMYPGVILIDHGHFQYNCVSLGFTTLSVIFLMQEKNILATIFFCLAINYKQMELYHSLPFFFYLLSTCIPKPGQKTVTGLISLLKLGLTVVLCFSLIWFPFIFNWKVALQVLHRQFPFSRGIFEDKVANFWCFFNIFYKLKTCNNLKLMRICLFTTLAAIFPSSIDLFLRPNLKKFILALINSSLAFFLFSYQVHEKTILVVALPVLLYLPENPFVCFWFLFISVFSMIPLFFKDGLIIATVALLCFYTVTFFVCMQHYHKRLRRMSIEPCEEFKFIQEISINFQKNKKTDLIKLFKQITKDTVLIKNFVFFFLMFISLLGCVFIFIIASVFNAPPRYPDLFTLLISVFSCFHFLCFFIYFNVKQIQISQDFGVLGNVKLKES